MDANLAIPREVPRLTAGRLLRLLGMLGVSRLLLLWVAKLAVAGPFGRGPDYNAALTSLADHLVKWDATWYRDIVLGGYYYHPDSASSVAFYPLFPLLVKFIRLLGVSDAVLAGYLVSNLALVGAVVALWKLAAFEFRRVAVADRAVALMLFCPGAIWFSMLYTESLFFLLLTLVMLGCRQRRWILAAAAGYAVALSRVPGILAAGFVAAEIFSAKPPIWRSCSGASGIGGRNSRPWQRGGRTPASRGPGPRRMISPPGCPTRYWAARWRSVWSACGTAGVGLTACSPARWCCSTWGRRISATSHVTSAWSCRSI